MALKARERFTALAIFLLLALCYGYFFPRWADPNQNSRLDMVVAVVDDGTFQIDRYVQNTVDYAQVGAHYYSDKAPGVALLGIPLYAGLKVALDQPLLRGLTDRLANSAAFQSTLRANGSGVLEDKVRFALAQVVLTFVIVSLPAALLGALLFLFLAHFTPALWPRLAVVLGYGLLTPVLAYAGAFYGHQLSAVLLFAAFYLLFRPRPAISTWALLAAGLLLGASVVTEYPSLLVVAILFVYAGHKLFRAGQWPRLGWVALTGGVMAAGWMVYNKTVFGSPFALGYSDSTLWLSQHDTGFMSLTYPHLDALWGITFGVFRGLFVLSPWLLLAGPGFVFWWRSGQRRDELWVCLLSVAAFVWFNASSIMWWGGFAVGPRYLLPALPCLAVPVIFVLQRWPRHNWQRLALGVLALWSLVATWGLTLADQAFPPDTIPNPFTAYALPNWLAGNIARNFGTLLGFRGPLSLLPLALASAVMAVTWWLVVRRSGVPAAQSAPVSPRPDGGDTRPGPYAGTPAS